jgi:hypothetical protein
MRHALDRHLTDFSIDFDTAKALFCDGVFRFQSPATAADLKYRELRDIHECPVPGSG